MRSQAFVRHIVTGARVVNHFLNTCGVSHSSGLQEEASGDAIYRRVWDMQAPEQRVQKILYKRHREDDGERAQVLEDIVRDPVCLHLCGL